uniref:Peptidase C1A papain C-terminal domain-containing protein n=1 Tax=Glossina palpalis gambiensis TaxID=67801 RepID=A0A1B0BQ90_9MUSC
MTYQKRYTVFVNIFILLIFIKNSSAGRHAHFAHDLKKVNDASPLAALIETSPQLLWIDVSDFGMGAVLQQYFNDCWGLSAWTSFLSRRKATPAGDTLKTTILEIMGKTDIVRFNRAGDAVFANGIGCTVKYIKAEIKDNDSCINSTTVFSSFPADVAFPLADNYIQIEGLSGWTSFLSRRKATPAGDTLKTTILEILGKTDIVRFNRAGDAVFANGIGCTVKYIKAEIKDNDSCINSTTVVQE